MTFTYKDLIVAFLSGFSLALVLSSFVLLGTLKKIRRDKP